MCSLQCGNTEEPSSKVRGENFQAVGIGSIVMDHKRSFSYRVNRDPPLLTV